MTAKILGIAGSLRKGSFNRRLLTAASHELPDGLALVTWDELAHVPPFDEDAEDGPAPRSVATLRTAILEADGLLIATPEYNGSIPGQLKNALDWASRPYGESSLSGKPAAVIGASPGQYGAAWAQAELRKVLGQAGANVSDAQVAVPEAFRQLDERDRLLDHELRTSLTALIAELHRTIRGDVPAA
ncbi:NADPH-dependent FMN reductase [Amycolatopsis anabasis]|uniref:NADPH-dependent FMN reductase n=1 Tax=Amycolatopsis anabasis TaxID=1840409 RepID=UPI00131B58D2|nr:NAD(P)H-dependent oxidoreductase [Amycolatopsis anabasis]